MWGGALVGGETGRDDLPLMEENPMMTGRERVIAALRFEKPDRAPRDLWALPYISLFRSDELDAMLDRFYAIRGWTSEGIPTDEKLSELGLK